MRISAAFFCLLLSCASSAFAARVEIPLRVPAPLIAEALGAQLAASPAGPNVLYRDGACSSLKMDAPEIAAQDGKLAFSAPGSAVLGVELIGQCQAAAAWRGHVHATLVPYVDAKGRLRVRIVDSRLQDPGGNIAAVGVLWDVTKRYLHPYLESFAFDLDVLREALRQLVATAAPPEQQAALDAALAGLQLLAPRVEPGAVIVPIAFEVPDAWLAPPSAAAAGPLTEAELEALDQALQPWDAFLVHALKQIALDGNDAALRQRLFTLLLDSRYQLSAILSGEAVAAGDPLRALFIDAWNELRAILAEFQRAGVLDPALARYAAFLDGGEALLALERAAPGLGMRFSAEGLRQLARLLSPSAVGDPLAFGWAVDAQLRTLFNVEGVPESPPPSPAPAPRSWLEPFMRSAHAAQPLDRWVPRRTELDAYEAAIEELLRKTAAAELQRVKLTAPYDRIYERLMPTTALIESCWRQYRIRGGKVTYVRSRAGSVGIMQINQRVWRGFYEVERLRWDTAYNARAGAQILMRYVKDYAIPYAEKSGQPDDVPRAAYAVYNAGPRAVGRFAKPKPHPREKRVDDKLWSLYQGFASGRRADLRSCSLESGEAEQLE